jgi:SEC-C motif
MLSTTPSGRGELLIQQGELAGRSYRFEALVCDNPTCQCERVTLKCFTEMPEARPDCPISVCLEMDLERQEIANLEELQANPTTRALANSVAAETGQEEWLQLRRVYWQQKQYWTEHSDLERVEVSFPPEVLAGTMVAYFDIFPFARRLEFTHEQESWLIDDQYCCNPKCQCQEAVLSFIRLPEKAGRDPLRPTLSISYRYRDGKVNRLEVEKNPRYSEQGLMESLKNAHDDLDSLLAKRQSLLRRMCGRTLKRQTIASPTPKIGRNDLCPCGSGKKWKRCCGA